jgi:hypothetical protein
MRAVKGFFLTLFVLAVLGGAAFGVLAWRQAMDARSLDNVIKEPAPPQDAPQADEIPVDPRLQGLLSRHDGARLLWAPETGERLLSAGFSDNGALVASVAYLQGKTEHGRVYALQIASGTPETLLDGDARVVSGDRSSQRNAGKLCYAKKGESVFDIWCSDLSGKNEKRLTTHDGAEDLMAPSVSPDGTWVAFEADGTEDPVSHKRTGGAIWKIGLNGAGIQQLTRGADDRAPSWSADGKKLYFQRRMPDGNWDAFFMEADGTDPTPLLRTVDLDELFPVRRGATDDFLLIEAASGTDARLKLLDAVTKAGTYLTDGRSGPESRPSVSPDGKLASFLAPTDPAKPEALGLWLVQLGD